MAIKSLIFRGDAFKNKESLITNLHLDLIVLSCIFHYLKHDLDKYRMKNLIQIYRSEVLFPIDLKESYLLQIYESVVKTELEN